MIKMSRRAVLAVCLLAFSTQLAVAQPGNPLVPAVNATQPVAMEEQVDVLVRLITAQQTALQAVAALVTAQADKEYEYAKDALLPSTGDQIAKVAIIWIACTAFTTVVMFVPEVRHNWRLYTAFLPQCPIFPVFLPHFRLYEVVSLHMCVLP